MYKKAVINETVSDSKELEEKAKELESTIRSNFESQYGENYEVNLSQELANYGFEGEDACFDFCMTSVKEKQMNTEFVIKNFDTYKEAVEQRNPRTISIISISVTDPENISDEEQKKMDNVDKEIKEESFGKAATEFSEDTSTANNKGFYGYTDSTDVTSTTYSYYGTGLPNEVASQAQDLKKGETSDWISVTASSGSTMMYKVYVNETSLKKLLNSDNEDVRDSLVSAFLSANSTLEMESIESYASKLDITYKDENTKKKIENYISSQLKTEGDGEDE